jgi:hypothetical protein
LLRFSPDFYTDTHITQEHIGESIKRIRAVHCKGTLRDTLNSFMPQPPGPRTAHIRVPEPVTIAPDADVPQTLEELRKRMQATLDQVNAEIDAMGRAIKYENPFLQ